MTDQFRVMCAELTDAYEHELNKRGMGCDLINRARALLAQSVEEGPSDEEIMELMPQQMRDDLAAAASALACGLAITGFERDSLKAAGVCRVILNRHAVDHARAALAKWGHPTPQPVAVSERLPGDVLSWWYEPDEDDDEGYGGKWTLLRIRGAAYTYTHWLPANALPTPEA